MKVETRADSDKMVIEVLENCLDAAIAVQFKDAIRDISSQAPPRVILDLGRVEFLDSSGLGSVVGAMKVLAPDRRLELANLKEPVHKVFRLTRLDTIFVIHERAPEIDAQPSDTAHAC